MSNEYKPTYVDNTDNSISIMESTDTISFCKTGTKINTLSAKNVAYKKSGEDLNLCAYDGSSFKSVLTINNEHNDCRIMTNLNVSGNLNIIGNGIINTSLGIGTTSLNNGFTGSNIHTNSILDINGQTTIRGHILPSINEQFDLGNAEYKIRHLFLSDNSLWIGDKHKIDVTDGTIKFRKRKTKSIPSSISLIKGDDSEEQIKTYIKNTFNRSAMPELSEIKLEEWHAYAQSKQSNIKIEDIFKPGIEGDWDENDTTMDKLVIKNNIDVSGNVNILNGGMIKTTGIGSFGSITATGNSSFNSITTTGSITTNNQNINAGSGSIITSGSGSFNSLTTSSYIGANTFLYVYGGRLKIGYSSSWTRIYNSLGTDGAFGAAGSYISYHDNGSGLDFNCPAAFTKHTNSSAFQFSMNGTKKMKIYGGLKPATEYWDENQFSYVRTGFSTSLPGDFGAFSNKLIPFLGSSKKKYWFGGNCPAATGDAWFFAANENGIVLSSSGNGAQGLRYVDEDHGSSSESNMTGWHITPSGSLSSNSDIRIKRDINTYKNSDFEKYKKIRTVTYKQEFPEKIKPEKYNTKSFIDKYNNIHYGVIAQEIYSLYPEIEHTHEVRLRQEWEYMRDNWELGEYDKALEKWNENKIIFEGENKNEEYKVPKPTKIFNEKEPLKCLDYNRLHIITIGVVQDIIKENELLKTEVATLKTIIDKLKTANSFEEFKLTL